MAKADGVEVCGARIQARLGGESNRNGRSTQRNDSLKMQGKQVDGFAYKYVASKLGGRKRGDIVNPYKRRGNLSLDSIVGGRKKRWTSAGQKENKGNTQTYFWKKHWHYGG